MSESGVRRAVRGSVLLEIAIDHQSDHNFWADLAMQLERGGVFFATYKPLSLGTVVELELTLPDACEPVSVAGVVRWVRPHLEGSDGSAGIGIKFLDLDPAALARVQRFASERAPMVFELEDAPMRRRRGAAA